MFIQLTAAFRSENQPNFESLGITPSEEDFEEVLWDYLYVAHDGIAAMNKSESGNTNLYLFNGDKWTVKETPEQIKKLLQTKAHQHE